MFLKFDKLCYSQFQHLKKNLGVNVTHQPAYQETSSHINFNDLHSKTQSSHEQYQKEQHADRNNDLLNTNMRDVLPPRQHAARNMQQINTVAMLLPRFQNPAGQNNCWFNSVLQIVLHALRKQSSAPDFPHVPTHDFARYGEVITAEMDYF